jgi:hypothetical protein
MALIPYLGLLLPLVVVGAAWAPEMVVRVVLAVVVALITLLELSAEQEQLDKVLQAAMVLRHLVTVLLAGVVVQAVSVETAATVLVEMAVLALHLQLRVLPLLALEAAVLLEIMVLAPRPQVGPLVLAAGLVVNKTLAAAATD